MGSSAFLVGRASFLTPSNSRGLKSVTGDRSPDYSASSSTPALLNPVTSGIKEVVEKYADKNTGNTVVNVTIHNHFEGNIQDLTIKEDK